MRSVTTIAQVERLEDQLQAIKWTLRLPRTTRGGQRGGAQHIVSRTAGLLRGRVPTGMTYQHRLRREWEHRLRREAS